VEVADRDLGDGEARQLAGVRGAPDLDVARVAISHGSDPRRHPFRKVLSGVAVSMTAGLPRRAQSTIRGLSTVSDRLVVRGAREHNLRDVSLDLPRDAMVVFTGISGSCTS